MKTSPSKRGEKLVEPPNFKLAKTRAALRELKTNYQSMQQYTTVHNLSVTCNVE